MGTYGAPRTISATGMVVLEARDMLFSAWYEHGQNFAFARRSTFAKKGCGPHISFGQADPSGHHPAQLHLDPLGGRLLGVLPVAGTTLARLLSDGPG